MTVSIRTLFQIASSLNAFFKAAAYGNEATALLAAIMQAQLTIAVGGGVSFEFVISAGVKSHDFNLLIELKTN